MSGALLQIFQREASAPEKRGGPSAPGKYVPWHFEALRIYQRDRTQKVVIFALAILSLLLGIGTFTNRSEVQTVIVRVGDNGAPLSAAVADANKLPVLTEKEILRTIADLTEWWRVKTTDGRNQRRQFSRLFAHLSRPANVKLKQIIHAGNLYPWVEPDAEKPYDPLGDIGEFTADIEYVSITQIGSQTYQSRYRETAYNSDGSVRARYLLVITYTLEQREPASPETVQRNPYGIFVSDLSATREQELS